MTSQEKTTLETVIGTLDKKRLAAHAPRMRRFYLQMITDVSQSALKENPVEDLRRYWQGQKTWNAAQDKVERDPEIDIYRVKARLYRSALALLG